MGQTVAGPRLAEAIAAAATGLGGPCCGVMKFEREKTASRRRGRRRSLMGGEAGKRRDREGSVGSPSLRRAPLVGARLREPSARPKISRRDP